MEHGSSRLFTNRNILVVAIVLFLLAFPYGRLALRPWHFASGFGLVLLGAALRGWSILQIGGSARKTTKLKAVRIISWGPYAMVRNPISIANITVLCGLTIAAGFPWLLPAVIAALGLWYGAVVRREERFLEASFPEDYAEYRRTTPRWLPRLRFRKRPVEVPPYPFTRMLRREQGGIHAVTAGSAATVIARLCIG